MSIPVTIPHIQADSGWSVVTGPDIGPAAPTIKLSAVPGPTSLAIDITGVTGKYADGVARSADYPIPPNPSTATLTVKFTVNAASLEFAQAVEIGAKFTGSDGTTLNGQLQFDCGHSPTEMTLDLTSTTGSGWAPTPYTMPKFAPDVPHSVVIAYKFDWAGKKISILSVILDGKLYATPPEMLGVLGKKLGWKTDAFQVNCQPNTNQKGGNWGWTLLEVTMQFA